MSGVKRGRELYDATHSREKPISKLENNKRVRDLLKERRQHKQQIGDGGPLGSGGDDAA